jgi:cell division protein FtsL
MRVGDARVLDRLVRGRAWIAIVAVALIGIVFMQVSMLKLNAGVSRAVTAADTLERQNSTLRADISQLDSGERVQDAAAKLGMVARGAGDVHYLDAARANAARAAASIKPPNPVAPVAQQQATTAQQQTPAVQQQTPAAQQQATTAQQQTTTVQQQSATAQQQAAATQQQATTAQQQSATVQQQSSQQTAPPATGTGTVAGGATATPGEG